MANFFDIENVKPAIWCDGGSEVTNEDALNEREDDAKFILRYYSEDEILARGIAHERMIQNSLRGIERCEKRISHHSYKMTDPDDVMGVEWHEGKLAHWKERLIHWNKCLAKDLEEYYFDCQLLDRKLA